ncbi:leucine-rich repeat flightless-interacting protein 1-like isoform X2 [Pomacea canaliculata]|uniref:leucine-rich repeat flightless-interacting protein 1-like isoform X2 n=1 Tax=Pomacea canaliculata TaxID=400727 RepID=UPI000D738DE0|nr:leucine-rich repeat flightless-interacting protein 1-like isoform X2 [Pomacea canaliculata]
MSSHSGRRRSNVRQYSAEDQALTQISKEAENRLAAKRAARAEAREIRMKEIERQQREEEKLNNEHIGVTKVKNKKLLTRQHPTGSRRGSDDSSEGSGDAPSGKDRDLRMELRSLEEKYKTAMMSSAQLDNEKQSLVYQVELLKDQLEEQAESYVELQREYKDKCRDLEMKKRELQAAEVELKALREANDYKDRLIAESGLTIVAAENGELALERTNESPSTNGPVSTGAVLLSAEAMDLLNKSSQGSLGMHCLASHASHTSYPTPSSSTSTTQQLGSSESSRLVGDGDSMVKATSADTLAQGIKSPDSHPLANNIKDSSQTEDQTDSGEIDKIFSSKTNTITGPELGQSEREAVVVDMAKSLIEIETSFSVDVEAKKLEKPGVSKTTTENTVMSDVETLVLVEGSESGESKADGEFSVPLDHSSSNKYSSEQNTACHLPIVNLDEGSSGCSAIICDSVLPPDEPLKDAEHFLNEKVQDTFKASSDHPAVVVTVSSHSQQNSSDVTESEDDGEEFFDAVSTPLPSPCHLSADSEVKDINLLKSCEEGVLEGKAAEVRVGEEGRAKDLGNGNGHLDVSLSDVGTAKDAADINLSKPPFDDTDASQSEEYPEADKQNVVGTAHTQGLKGGCTEGSQDHKEEEVGVSIIKEIAIGEETNASSQQEETAQEDVKESDSLAELTGLEAFDTKGAVQRENVDSADGNKYMGESLADDGESEKDDTSGSDKDKAMITADICKEQILLAEDVHDESKTSQVNSDGENTYDKARVCEGVSEIDHVASEGSDLKAKIIDVSEGENVANNSSDKEKLLLHDGENGALRSSDCEISVSADVNEERESLSVDKNGIKTMPDDIERESEPFESNEGESRLLEDADTEENDRSTENTLGDPDTSATAAEAISDNSKMDEPIETTESVKGDAKLSEDASAEENDETTQNTLCEVDTSVAAAEAIAENRKMDEPIETTESVKGDAKLSEDVSAGENDESADASDAFQGQSEMVKPFESKEESVKDEANLSEETDESIRNAHAGACTSVVAADLCPDHNKTGKTDDRREDCMSDIIEGEVQAGEKIEKATCSEAILTSSLDKRCDLDVKCKDDLDVAPLTLNSTENSRQDLNEGDHSDDQSRPPESILCGEDGNSLILITEKSSDATVCVPVENVSFPISLKEETNLSNSVENTSSSNESALLENALTFEEGVSKDDVTTAQGERQLENIPSCIQDITSSEFEQNERDVVNKETESEGAASIENKLSEENTVEAAEDEKDEENQEGIDAVPSPTADVKAKDHSDGWESENSEALLDEEYDFDDIDEVLDDSDKERPVKMQTYNRT